MTEGRGDQVGRIGLWVCHVSRYGTRKITVCEILGKKKRKKNFFLGFLGETEAVQEFGEYKEKR